MRFLRRILGGSTNGPSVREAYEEAAGMLAADAECRSLIARIARVPDDNRWYQRKLTPHQASLLYAFLKNDAPRFRGNCSRLDTAFVHMLPFIALPEDEAVRALSMYVTWRKYPERTNVGSLADYVRRGLIAMTFDDTGLQEFFLYPYWVQFWLEDVAHEGWGRILPQNAPWGHFFQSGEGRIQILGHPSH
jgi:hypothetical protein